ncbi:hypothetical protein NQ318_011507 [Aromia moschata]|uniref:Transmembrane protein n=1 Tax=Aromia moschata TaxID=1265417 RepID=A0AAV8XSF5_9CUCU|nr:hypothetical protein NQ318_011507 [Aromia moschata]
MASEVVGRPIAQFLSHKERDGEAHGTLTTNPRSLRLYLEKWITRGCEVLSPLVNLFHRLGLSMLAGGGWSFLICSRNAALSVCGFSTDVASPISRRSRIIFLRMVFFMLRCLSRVLYLCFALLSTLLSAGALGFSLLSSDSTLQFHISRTSFIFLSFNEDIFHYSAWKIGPRILSSLRLNIAALSRKPSRLYGHKTKENETLRMRRVSFCSKL